MKPIADYSFLIEAADGNRAFMKNMLALTVQEFEASLPQITAFVQNANHKELRELKHKLAPHLESFKLPHIHQQVESLQKSLEKQPASKDLQSLVYKLSEDLKAVIQEFKEKIKSI